MARRAWTTTAALAAAGLALSALSAPAATAEPPSARVSAQATPAARDVAEACPADALAEGFPDVDPGSTHGASVSCLAWWAVTAGTLGGGFGPEEAVSRGQMASFLARAVVRGGGELPAVPPDAFTDDEGSAHERAIDQLAAAGVVLGRGDGTYSPGTSVRRDQMASFLVRAAEHVLGEPLPDGGDQFSDDDGNAHESAIGKAAAAGVTGGRGDGTYGVDGDVRRGQMASFLVRVLDLLVQDRLGTVHVEFGARPAEVPAVTLSGPGQPVDVSAGGTWAVSPGVWDVVTSEVTSDDATYGPLVVGAPALVTPGSATSAAVSWREVVVGATTTVLDAGEVTASSPGAGGADLTVAESAGVQTGDVVVVPPSDAVPTGWFGAVESVQPDGAGSVQVATTEASLLDVLPQGAFDVAAVVQAGELQAAAGHGLRQQLADTLQCEAGGTVEVSGGLSFTPTVHASADWSLLDGLQELSVVVTGVAEAQLSALAQAAAGCDVGPVLLPAQPVTLPTLRFAVAGVPVWITPSVQFRVSASAEVTGSLTTSVTQAYTLTAGAAWEKGVGFRGIGKASESFVHEPAAPEQVAGHVGVVAGPALDVLLYGLAGVRLNVDGLVDLDVRPVEDPWWELTAGVRGGARLVAPAMGWDWGRDDLLSRSWTLAEAPPRHVPGTDPCTGLAHCRTVDRVDVDGDGTLDLVGLAGLPVDGLWISAESPLTLRVSTDRQMLTTELAVERWYDDDLYQGAGQVDGVPGAELAVGNVHGTHTPWTRLLTYRDGELQLLPSPRGTDAPDGWAVDAYAGGYAGYTCSDGGVVADRWVDVWESVAHEDVWRWDATAWSHVSSRSVPLDDPYAPPPGFEAGWHCPDIVDPYGEHWELDAYAVGPVPFGTPEDEMLTTLTAEWGEPDSVVEGGCELGGPYVGRFYDWGDLSLHVYAPEGETPTLTSWSVFGPLLPGEADVPFGLLPGGASRTEVVAGGAEHDPGTSDVFGGEWYVDGEMAWLFAPDAGPLEAVHGRPPFCE